LGLKIKLPGNRRLFPTLGNMKLWTMERMETMYRFVVHLNDGKSIPGNWVELTEEEIEAGKKSFAETLTSSGGWQVNLEFGNSWAVFPKQSVNYVEIQSKKDFD
jgi:hypothetical protein